MAQATFSQIVRFIQLPPAAVPEGRTAEELAALAYAASTSRAFRADIDHFRCWCGLHGYDALPAEPTAVASYIASCCGQFSTATVRRRFAAIRKAHIVMGFPSPLGSPEVQAVWRGLRRVQGSASLHAKKPLLLEDIRKICATLDPTKETGIRDRALILLGFAGAFRRGELCALDRDDLEFTKRGIRVRIRRSKTDQTGRGRTVGIPYGEHPETCPVRAVEEWLRASPKESGALFHSHRGARKRLTDQMVRLIVRRTCRAAGIDAAPYGAHSLRAGFVTQAIRGGATDHAVMDQTGHRDVQMIRRYRREADIFRDNAAEKLGL